LLNYYNTILQLDYSWPIIFANLLRSRYSRNKGHAEIMGFAVLQTDRQHCGIISAYCSILS